jgi:hypothetical protein
LHYQNQSFFILFNFFNFFKNNNQKYTTWECDPLSNSSDDSECVLTSSFSTPTPENIEIFSPVDFS